VTTQVVKDLATLGLGIGAPLMLLTGIGVGVTIIAGTPPLLGFAFLFAGGLTLVSGLAYLAADAVERSQGGEPD
jgi:hypothetical protein